MMERRTNGRIFGLVGLGVAIAMALVTGCAAIAGGGGGGVPVPTPQPGAGYLPNTISVSGYGEATGAPDIAYVMLGVNVVDPDVGDAVVKAGQAMQRVQEAMEQAGVAPEDIQTVNYSVWPEDRYDPQTGQPTGERVYHVDNMLNIKVRDLDQVGEIIEAGLSAGANAVNGLSFGVEDTKALEEEARREAVSDARARAEQIAETLGVKLGAPVMVTEGYGSFPIPTYYPMVAADAMGVGGGGAAAPISPGQLTVSMGVSVVFSIDR